MRKIRTIVLLILCLIFLSGCNLADLLSTEVTENTFSSIAQTNTLASDAPVTEKVTVERVVDGDTIWVQDSSGNEFKVRIIGVDTPETEKENQEGEFFAEEATQFAEQLLLDKEVFLERDVSDTDKYGRYLRYVWLLEPQNGDDETVLQYNFSALLIRGGYGCFVAIGDDTKYEEVLRDAELLAVSDKLGMWSVQ
jgi:micrococcal nuclease